MHKSHGRQPWRRPLGRKRTSWDLNPLGLAPCAIYHRLSPDSSPLPSPPGGRWLPPVTVTVRRAGSSWGPLLVNHDPRRSPTQLAPQTACRAKPDVPGPSPLPLKPLLPRAKTWGSRHLLALSSWMPFPKLVHPLLQWDHQWRWECAVIMWVSFTGEGQCSSLAFYRPSMSWHFVDFCHCQMSLLTCSVHNE